MTDLTVQAALARPPVKRQRPREEDDASTTVCPACHHRDNDHGPRGCAECPCRRCRNCDEPFLARRDEPECPACAGAGQMAARPVAAPKSASEKPRVQDTTKQPLRRAPGPDPLNVGWSVQSGFDWRRDRA